MNPLNFVGTYKVKQGDSNPPTAAQISTLDTVELAEAPSGHPNYTITVTAPSRSKPLIFDLTWNDDSASLGGDLPGAPSESTTIVQVSLYAQDQEPGGPYPLKVLYGTIIDTDPDSAGAWSADDEGT